MKRLTSLAVVLLLPALLVGLTIAEDEKDKADKPLGFELKSSEGTTFKLEDLEDKIVVLEWTNDQCPYVVRHYEAGTMKKLAEQYAKKGVVWLAIDSSHFAKAEGMEAWRKKWKLSYPILMDTTGTVGRAFGAKSTPQMFILKNGKKLYEGAIDDAPRGKATINYVAQALDEILAGKPVSKPKTKAYGCGVKYGPNTAS